MRLAEHFIHKYCLKFNLKETALTADGQQYLLNQYWEGNVRELENVIQRSIVLAQGQPLSSTFVKYATWSYISTYRTIHHLLPEPDMKPIQSLADVEQDAIINALRVTNYKITEAAKQLGVSRTTLYAKITNIIFLYRLK